jgi:membrane protein
MRIPKALNNIGHLVKEAFRNFFDDNATKLSASLSFYTIFSLPPLLLIIIYLCGLLFGFRAIRTTIFDQLNGAIGNDAAMQIQLAIKFILHSRHSGIAAWIGIITLIIGATGMFAEMQSSLNYIWGLKAKPQKNMVKFIQNKVWAIVMIVVMGVTLLAGLMLNFIMNILGQQIALLMPDIAVHVVHAANIAVVFINIAALFTIIFRFLPDARVAWKDAFVGASCTSLLFMIGKFGISTYLAHSNVASAYGVAGSLISLLLWIYYSAFILYFGAEFTRVYACTHGNKIVPLSYAVLIDKSVREIGSDS